MEKGAAAEPFEHGKLRVRAAFAVLFSGEVHAHCVFYFFAASARAMIAATSARVTGASGLKVPSG